MDTNSSSGAGVDTDAAVVSLPRDAACLVAGGHDVAVGRTGRDAARRQAPRARAVDGVRLLHGRRREVHAQLRRVLLQRRRVVRALSFRRFIALGVGS